MKKFLLSLTLLTAVLIGQAQQRDLWFNEVVPWPANNDEEYIEFYNTSTSEISLDCYVLVSIDPNGAYVYNFPANAKLKGLSYYLISSDYKVDFKAEDKDGKRSYTFTATDPHASNWNDIGIGGSIARYPYNSNTKSWGNPTSIGSNFNNLIHDAQVSLLIYKINADGTTSLVNGFFSKEIPTSVTSLPNLSIPSNGCAAAATVPIVFNDGKITAQSTEIGPATGTQQGYSKIGNGICGNWVKTQNRLEFTPAKANPPVIVGSTLANSLTTSQKLVCGNRIDFSITAPASGILYPVEVMLYIDANKDGVFDADDTYVATYPKPIGAGSTTIYSFENLASLPSTQQYILVYKTASGCFDKVIAPTVVSGSLQTTEKYICGTQVDFTITGAVGNFTQTNIFPIEVEMYLDTDGDGNPDKDTVGATVGDGNLLAEKTITSFSSLRQTIEIPDGYKNQKVVIIYNSALSCLKLSKVPQEPVITLTTTPKNFCGNKVEFTITGASADATTYAFPMKAQLFYDGDNDGEFDEAYGDPVDVPGTGPTVYSISIAPADADNVFRVQYSSNTFACINEQKATVAGTLSFTTAQFGVCTNSTTYTVNYNVTGGSGDLTSAYPFKAYLYADDGDGKFDADDALLQTSDDITSVGGNEKYFFKVPGDKSVFIVYRNATGCFEQVSGSIEAPEASSCSVLPVTYQSFTAKRSNSNQVVLEWETATEAANKGFHIQRNIDGTWKEAGFVFSQATGGNSSTVLKYTFRDVNASKGISQYRILQVDANGKGQYSEIRAVRGDGALARMMVFPNPSTTGSVSLLFEDGASVRNIIINDVSGRAIRQYKGISHSSLTVDQLQSGFYTVVVTNQTTGITTTEKIIIKKR